MIRDDAGSLFFAGMGESMHLPGPAEKAKELTLLLPHEVQEVSRLDGLCGLAGVGLQPPAQIGASPGP